MSLARKSIIPPEAIPEVDSFTKTIDGKDYLVLNDAMFTFYQRTQGEFSEFFLALRDDKKMLGCKCTNCGVVRVPPFVVRCPDCDFAPTETVEVEDVGYMLSTPPITYFANSLFAQQVPFGRGRVVLKGADTGLSLNVYTTTGILVPGIIRKNTEMKIVFRDDRSGEITDIFAVPTSELTPEQIAKKGLTESELDWEKAKEPEVGAGDTAAFAKALAELEQLTADMRKSERARKDIADWKRVIQVKSAGGSLVLEIDDGNMYVKEGSADKPDFTMVCEDINTLLDGLAYRGSLTQAIMSKELWVSLNQEFTTIFKLERMSRSLARTKKEG
ncbi:MAG: hypothetical protein CVU59_10810 [Deltaproteobacteria bacterium HGW-Deltaproteobacteria-17]|nr:MAG: hypothetical protein CVU59_10810 [Deltaproteobacteria bacterium HGW-Deltaproteobacteria-17]